MLLRKNLCWCHQRPLISRECCIHQRKYCNNCLSRTNIALNKPAHKPVALHIFLYFLPCFLLGICQRIWQCFKKLVSSGVIRYMKTVGKSFRSVFERPDCKYKQEKLFKSQPFSCLNVIIHCSGKMYIYHRKIMFSKVIFCPYILRYKFLFKSGIVLF